METVGSYEAKTNLSKLLECVAKGERITIAKHGVPVAVLQPYDARKSEDVTAVIAQLRQFRASHNLDELSIRNMIEEGRD